MTDPIEIQKVKLNTLANFFTDLGYKVSSRVGQNEFRLFLNKKSKTGRFDPLLTDKLFEVLSLDESSSMTIEEFINGFLEFEEEVKKNAELFNIKLAREQEIYDKILKQCNAYKTEKLNAEGFCENAKIFGEITDIDIKQKLEGIKEIIIIIIYNEKKVELRFRIGDNSSTELLKKSFEFKPTSRKDHFEFIMKGVNEKDQIFDIGSRVFPLNDIVSQEEYLVQIMIPEMDNPDKIVAFINAKIVLYMSDYKYYEALRRKQEKRLKKYMTAANKAVEYLKYVREIYGDLSQMKPELIVEFNNEKLMQRKGAKLNLNFNNMIEGETSGGNFFVEFNNEREVQTRGIPLRVEFNNSKEVLSPVTETETKKVEYKYNYTSDTNQSIINNIEKRIELLEKEKENITNNLENIPKPDIDQIIKKTTESIITKKEIPKIPDTYTNEKIIKETIKTKEIINEPKSTSILLPPVTNSQVVKKIVKTENISTPTIAKTQITGTKYDIDSLLKQTKTQLNTQTQSFQGPYITPINESNNMGTGGYIEETTETTKTITTTPGFSQNQFQTQNISVNGQQTGDAFINSFLKGNIGNGTTTIETTTNMGNISSTNITSGEYQEEGTIGYGTDITGRVNEYDIVGKSGTQTLDPIINKIQVNSSYNNAIFNEKTNKEFVTEKTLPVSYLPEKVNKIIVDERVRTLPLITTNNAPTYGTLQPIIHESQTVHTGQNTGENIMGNFAGATNNLGSNFGIDYNFNANGSSNYTGNFGVNGFSDNNIISSDNYNITNLNTVGDNNANFTHFSTVSNDNNLFSTQGAGTAMTQVSEYNPTFNMNIQGSTIEGGQQIQYNI